MNENPEAGAEGGPLTLSSFSSLLDLGAPENLPGRQSAFLAHLQPGKLAFPGERLFLQGEALLPAPLVLSTAILEAWVYTLNQ